MSDRVVHKVTNRLYAWSKPKYSDSVRDSARIMSITSASLGPDVTCLSTQGQMRLPWLQYRLDVCEQPLNLTEHSCENTCNPPAPGIRTPWSTHTRTHTTSPISRSCIICILKMFFSHWLTSCTQNYFCLVSRQTAVSLAVRTRTMHTCGS